MSELVWADALAQSEAIRLGTVSATELLEAYLDRIERLNPTLRAFVALDEQRARQEARLVDGTVRAGGADRLSPFSGVTISIKDVIDVAGLPTTNSCKVLAGNVATADAPLVQVLRRAGFIVPGKTNVPEFCTSVTTSELHGVCRNPWDLDRTPAGSSGGAAVSVAGGLCAIAHGTDGAGSVRVLRARGREADTGAGVVRPRARQPLLRHLSRRAAQPKRPRRRGRSRCARGPDRALHRRDQRRRSGAAHRGVRRAPVRTC